MSDSKRSHPLREGLSVLRLRNGEWLLCTIQRSAAPFLPPRRPDVPNGGPERGRYRKAARPLPRGPSSRLNEAVSGAPGASRPAGVREAESALQPVAFAQSRHAPMAGHPVNGHVRQLRAGVSIRQLGARAGLVGRPRTCRCGTQLDTSGPAYAGASGASRPNSPLSDAIPPYQRSRTGPEWHAARHPVRSKTGRPPGDLATVTLRGGGAGWGQQDSTSDSRLSDIID